MSVIDYEFVTEGNLVPGDRITVLMFDKTSASAKYGVYTGLNDWSRKPEINEVRLFENGLWMMDGTRWVNVTKCPMTREIHIPDSEIPFCDFDNILEEEVEASECL